MMKVCIPTLGDKGMGDKVSEHFGSAPYFTVIDLESSEVQVIDNQNHHHEHGQCNPMASLMGKGINAVICGGMGKGAFDKLNSSGIKVYVGDEATVTAVIESYKLGKVKELSVEGACGGHGCH